MDHEGSPLLILSQPSSFLTVRAYLPTEEAHFYRGGGSRKPGQRPLLETVQTQECQRSEISFSPGGSSALLRPGGMGGGETCQGSQPDGRGSRGASCPAPVQPRPPNAPAAQEPQASLVTLESIQPPRDSKHLEEAGEGSPHTHSHSGILPFAPSAPHLSRLKAPRCPEGLAIHNPSCPVAFAKASQWGSLASWECQQVRS